MNDKDLNELTIKAELEGQVTFVDFLRIMDLLNRARADVKSLEHRVSVRDHALNIANGADGGGDDEVADPDILPTKVKNAKRYEPKVLYIDREDPRYTDVKAERDVFYKECQRLQAELDTLKAAVKEKT